MKLALGTVQFGLDYGINNFEGKPSREKAFGILEKAYHSEVEFLDTADLYGDALEVLGEFNLKTGLHFKIMSKLVLANPDEKIATKLKSALERLKQNSLDTYFFHRFSDYASYKNLAQEVSDLKAAGLISKLGVSLYSDEELSIACCDPAVDVIQLPFNILDSSDKKCDLLEEARRNGKEIHIRSLYLQGLFYKNISELSGNLVDLKEALEKFHQLRTETGLSVEQICFGFANSHPLDVIVIGVDNEDQLARNLELSKFHISPELIKELKKIKNFNRDLLNPSNWRK